MEEKLIELTKKYDFLYNLESGCYKDTIKKDEAWNKIGKELNMSGELSKKKWKNLRDSYKRIKQQSVIKSGSEAPERKRPWKFEEQIRFLDDVRSSRKTLSNVTPESLDDSVIDLTDYFETVEQETPHCTKPKSKKQKVDSVQDKFESFLETASSSVASIQQKSGNSTTLLFESLAKRISMAGITIKQICELEQSVCNLVFSKLAEFISENSSGIYND